MTSGDTSGVRINYLTRAEYWEGLAQTSEARSLALRKENASLFDIAAVDQQAAAFKRAAQGERREWVDQVLADVSAGKNVTTEIAALRAYLRSTL